MSEAPTTSAYDHAAAVVHGRHAAPDRPRRHGRRWLLAFGACVVLLGTAATAIWAYLEFERAVQASVPAVATIDPFAGLRDRPLTITLTVLGTRVPWVATEDEVRNATRLWQRMHLADWNAVPEALRQEGLTNMIERYRYYLARPERWDEMSARDWDGVPQPIRTIAYREMVVYWVGYYRVGAAYEFPRGIVSEVLAAMVMTESWFDHRAVYTNSDNSRDLGLAQASDFARERIRQLYRSGVVDATFTDDDYFNPWSGTRFLAIWMGLMLDEAGGDLDLAIRAYNRGIQQALDEAGTTYLRTVRRRLDIFIRNHNAPAAWRFAWTKAREVVREEWPWLSSRRNPN